MTSFRSEVQIDAPPERVFAVVSDLRSAPERIRGIKRIEVLTEGPTRKGTRFRETRVMFGKEATEEMEVTEFTPGRGYVVECDSCGCHYRSVITAEPAAGGTRLSFDMDARPLTLIAKVLGAIMSPLMAKTMRKCFEQDLADIKRSVEAA